MLVYMWGYLNILRHIRYICKLWCACLVMVISRRGQLTGYFWPCDRWPICEEIPGSSWSKAAKSCVDKAGRVKSFSACNAGLADLPSAVRQAASVRRKWGTPNNCTYRSSLCQPCTSAHDAQARDRGESKPLICFYRFIVTGVRAAISKQTRQGPQGLAHHWCICYNSSPQGLPQSPRVRIRKITYDFFAKLHRIFRKKNCNSSIP